MSAHRFTNPNRWTVDKWTLDISSWMNARNKWPWKRTPWLKKNLVKAGQTNIPCDGGGFWGYYPSPICHEPEIPNSIPFIMTNVMNTLRPRNLRPCKLRSFFLFYKRFPPITSHIHISCGHCLVFPPKNHNLRGLCVFRWIDKMPCAGILENFEEHSSRHL